MNDNSSAYAGAMATFMSMAVFFVIIGFAVLAFTIWLNWRIFTKAGYNGALSLLSIVPFGPLICQLILAFGRWPLEDELAALRAAAPVPGGVPPGTSVMPTS
ncbi:MAG TPA: hypothetical protein VKR56_04520 [Candidatus Cybelea sp.]|jgi:hypothetical protein|nr:hypothetical protein [Candidatus Cybelea sp.]